MIEIEARFWAKVDWSLADTERCWPWLASKMWRGYGQIAMIAADGQKFVARAHRVAYELYTGDLLGKMHIDHTCHNPDVCDVGEQCPHRACCNPHHMRVVSNAQNHASGRTNSGNGGRAAMARATPEQNRARSLKSWETRRARMAVNAS